VAPDGGEASPIDRFTTMMTPKNTGSIPSFLTRGNRTGAKMMIEGTVSITVPTSRSKRLTIKRNTHGLSLTPVNAFASWSGIFHLAKIQP